MRSRAASPPGFGLFCVGPFSAADMHVHSSFTDHSGVALSIFSDLRDYCRFRCTPAQVAALVTHSASVRMKQRHELLQRV